MHEILSLALVVLGYTSPLDYSHLNLWIMWGRPRVQKKMVFPSANKIFSRLSVGIWMHCHCSGVPCIFLFCRLSIPIPLRCWCRQTPCQSCAEWQNSAGRQRQQGSAAPSLGGKHGSGCRHMDESFPTAQCSVNPPSWGPLWEAPCQRRWPPLLKANTFTPFSDLACACGGRSFGSSTALSEADLWVSSVPFLGTAGAGRGTDFTCTGTACPTWQLALPWPTSTTMGTCAH